MVLTKGREIGKIMGIIDGTQVTKAKPASEDFLKAAAALTMQPENCVVFEDAVAGIEAAINGEMRSIGVGSPEILGKADFVIPGFSEMNFGRLKSL